MENGTEHERAMAQGEVAEDEARDDGGVDLEDRLPVVANAVHHDHPRERGDAEVSTEAERHVPAPETLPGEEHQEVRGMVEKEKP